MFYNDEEAAVASDDATQAPAPATDAPAVEEPVEGAEPKTE